MAPEEGADSGKGDALIAATGGYVTIHENWWNPASATIRYTDGRVVELDAPFEGGGLNYETAHFCELIRAGQLESPVMTHAKSSTRSDRRNSSADANV